MSDTFMRRIQLDFSQELIPQLVELTSDADPEVAKWAAENLRNEIEMARFTAWLARRGVEPARLALEEPTLYEQFRASTRPKLAVVKRSADTRR
jgi:hypothetical protein